MFSEHAKGDYTSVRLPVLERHDEERAEAVIPKRKCSTIGIWRMWNRLSSLQKFIVGFAGFAAVLSVLYLIPVLYAEYAAINKKSDKDDVHMSAREEVKIVDTFDEKKQDAIESDVNRQQGREPKPGKRGPPVRGRYTGQRQVYEPGEGDVQGQLQPPKQGDVGGGSIDQKGKVMWDGGPLKFTGASNSRQRAVSDAMRHAWTGYKKYAWGRDQLKPITRSYHEWFGVGLTILDSLDTLIIMNLTNEYDEAYSWVKHTLTFDKSRDVNLFEMTIRCLGGLLSAYHLTDDRLYLDRALDVGDRLLGAFSSPSPIPYSDVNLHTKQGRPPKWSPDSSTSEVTTIQLEFRDLSRSSGIDIYESKIDSINKHVHGLKKPHGLVPIFINPKTGAFKPGTTITMGARGDSYYEYLLKQWLQTGQTDDDIKQDYMASIEGMRDHLIGHSHPGKLTFVGELLSGTSYSPKMDHLVCFLPGTLLLGHRLGGMPAWHADLAAHLLHTCYRMYADMPTGLSPEISYFNQDQAERGDIIVKPMDAHNLLRPETVESLYYFYALTGNRTYQEWGWNIFKAFEKYTKVEDAGYTSINNVQNPDNVSPRNAMESFFLGETLKYFYLLFADDRNIVPLDQFVINTEAHLLPIYST